MEKQVRNETRDYVWKYFALHADQRLKAFNFYLLLVAVVVGGLLAYLKDARSPAFASPAGFLMAVLSYVFWRMDGRSQEFIKHAEEILIAIEKDIPPNEVPEPLRLFLVQNSKTQQFRSECGIPGWNPRSWLWGHFGYYACFKAAFVIFALLGIVIGVGVFFLPNSTPPVPQP